jgi:hypothetical protein
VGGIRLAALLTFTPILAVALVLAPGRAQELPLFDAHLHYNQADWAVFSPEAALAILDQSGVRWAMVSSTPDEGTIRLYEKAPDRIAPVLRPYRTPADQGTWTQDPSILPYVEQRLPRGIYRGIGEFHLSADQVGSPVVRGFAALAARQGLFLYAHTDDAGVEALLRLDPAPRILWAHAGMSAAPAVIGHLLDRHPRLLVDLSLRAVAGGGRLEPAWRDLFLRYPDRFLVGSDTWVTSRWGSLPAIHSESRRWLAQLPREIAEQLAYKNALRLTRRP